LSVKVTVPAAGVAVVAVNAKQVPLPAVLVIVETTEVAVLKENPDGALKMNVPLLGKSPFAPSAMVGPVSLVHVAVPFVVLVSALIALPPVAAVTVTAAKALFMPTKNKTDAKNANVIAPKTRI
jgi:hypothetical protein